MGDPVVDPRLESFDLLTELWRQSAEDWAARVQLAETRAAAVATAAAALGTLLVSQAEAFRQAEGRAMLAFALLMAAVATSLLARVTPRGKFVTATKTFFTSAGGQDGGIKSHLRRTRSCFPTDKQQVARRSLEAVSQAGDALKHADHDHAPLVVREVLHDYWRARAKNNHDAYNKKARWVTFAALLLTVAALFLAAAGLTILDDTASSAAKAQAKR